ncbi:MAG: hypothetical protein ACRDNX_14090 [Gaiellaceae bacterium]
MLFAGAPILTAERIVRRLAEQIARGTIGAGHELPTIAWGVAHPPPSARSLLSCTASVLHP